VLWYLAGESMGVSTSSGNMESSRASFSRSSSSISSLHHRITIIDFCLFFRSVPDPVDPYLIGLSDPYPNFLKHIKITKKSPCFFLFFSKSGISDLLTLKK
jgi:hypothetical protein